MEIRYLAQIKKVVSAGLLILGLLGCSKEDGGELDYTAWKGYNDAGVLRLLSFKPDNVVEDLIYLSLDGDPIRYKVTYSLNGNRLDLIEATGVYATGEFNGNVLVIDYGYEDGVWTLKKQ